MTGIGLTYDNKKASLGSGISITAPKSYVDSQGNTWVWSSLEGAYEISDEILVKAKKETGIDNQRTWLLIIGIAIILIAISYSYKKFF